MEAKKIEQLFYLNYKPAQIALKLNMTEEEVKKIIKANSFTTKRSRYYYLKIKEGLEQHKTILEVADELKLTPRKISNIAAHYKIHTYFCKNKIERKEKIIYDEYQKENISISEMSRKTGISYSFCKNVYEKHNLINIKKRRKQVFKKLNPDKYQDIITEIKQDDLSLAQIAKKYGVSRQWISYIKKKLNET